MPDRSSSRPVDCSLYSIRGDLAKHMYMRIVIAVYHRRRRRRARRSRHQARINDSAIRPSVYSIHVSRRKTRPRALRMPRKIRASSGDSFFSFSSIRIVTHCSTQPRGFLTTRANSIAGQSASPVAAALRAQAYGYRIRGEKEPACVCSFGERGASLPVRPLEPAARPLRLRTTAPLLSQFHHGRDTPGKCWLNECSFT